MSQRLFRDVGLRFGFTSRPLVVQNRNQHNIIADLDAEAHLYTRAKQLIKYLNAWKGSGKSLVSRVEELWIALYEREYIELEDVKFVQLWLQSLIDAGYEFPKLVDVESKKNIFIQWWRRMIAILNTNSKQALLKGLLYGHLTAHREQN